MHQGQRALIEIPRYVAKVWGLKTGFTSLRKCHLCSSEDVDGQSIQIMRYTVSCANAIFDILHQNGVFLPARAKHRAIILFRDVCAF
ncbi:unnamed protein product [Durusdinium trenchii]|uniref:Uncharacterized protein n=1 Tax=Durusdinium trenchii TaxID=1381693 RepID=A0ABP0RVZ7_9DINO